MTTKNAEFLKDLKVFFDKHRCLVFVNEHFDMVFVCENGAVVDVGEDLCRDDFEDLIKAEERKGKK